MTIFKFFFKSFFILGCLPCSNATDEPQFYCQLSNTCIPKHQVCDEKYDCKFQEDER